MTLNINKFTDVSLDCFVSKYSTRNMPLKPVSVKIPNYNYNVGQIE